VTFCSRRIGQRVSNGSANCGKWWESGVKCETQIWLNRAKAEPSGRALRYLPCRRSRVRAPSSALKGPVNGAFLLPRRRRVSPMCPGPRRNLVVQQSVRAIQAERRRGGAWRRATSHRDGYPPASWTRDVAPRSGAGHRVSSARRSRSSVPQLARSACSSTRTRSSRVDSPASSQTAEATVAMPWGTRTASRRRGPPRPRRARYAEPDVLAANGESRRGGSQARS